MKEDYLNSELSRAIKETKTICLSSKMAEVLHNIRVTDVDILDFCKTKQRQISGENSIYSNSLKGIVILVDSHLKYSSKVNREFLTLCNIGPEIHFESIDTQLEEIKRSLEQKGEHLEEGDWFITKHSNLGNINVVFHLVYDQNKNEGELLPDQSGMRGLAKIFRAAAQYDVDTLAIPGILAELADEPLRIPIECATKRALAILSLIKTFLGDVVSEDVHEYQIVVPRLSFSKDLLQTIHGALSNYFKIVQ